MSEAPFSWTEQNVERLRALVEEGHTAADIGNALGCGRNAVIGKVHRLKLQLAIPQGGEGVVVARERANGISRSPKKPKPPASRRLVPPPPAVPASPPVDPTPKAWPKPAGPEAVDITGLRAGLCAMPLWANSERGGLFCGKPVAREGSSWCAACRQLVFEARPVRQQEEAQARAARQARQAARNGAFA